MVNHVTVYSQQDLKYWQIKNTIIMDWIYDKLGKRLFWYNFAGYV